MGDGEGEDGSGRKGHWVVDEVLLKHRGCYQRLYVVR